MGQLGRVGQGCDGGRWHLAPRVTVAQPLLHGRHHHRPPGSLCTGLQTLPGLSYRTRVAGVEAGFLYFIEEYPKGQRSKALPKVTGFSKVGSA